MIRFNSLALALFLAASGMSAPTAIAQTNTTQRAAIQRAVAQMLAANPRGGAALQNAIARYVTANPAAATIVAAMLRRANPAQQRAGGAALGQVYANALAAGNQAVLNQDRKSTRLNSSHT